MRLFSLNSNDHCYDHGKENGLIEVLIGTAIGPNGRETFT